ncbi:MAG: glycosyltransferase family 4 protein [Chloroflexota bacterium]|nr:glycosyltransferase family 4 protein [Chloroflexota bacterium]
MQVALGHRVVIAVGSVGVFSSTLARAGIDFRDLGWSERYVGISQAAPWGSVLAGLPDIARAARELRRLVRSLRPDVVQAHTRKAQLVASLALADIDIPLVWHLRDGLPARAPLRALIGHALRRADHAVALSQWLAQSYVESGAVPRSGRIGVVPSGVDGRRLAQLPTPWLSGERRPVIGYVGQIARWKGPHLLIEAAEHLDDPELTFRLIGGVWFPGEEAYGRSVRRRLQRSPAARRVEWRPTTEHPEHAFEQIDVLAHTSLAPEPFGRVLVEAMIARRPIIALNSGSASELLDEQTAVFADRPDGPAIAAAVSALINDRESARLLVERAAGRATRFSPSAVGALMDSEYALMGR